MVSFYRIRAEDTLLVVHNVSAEAAALPHPAEVQNRFSRLIWADRVKGVGAVLPGYSSLVLGQ